jgi:hypothetical protein
MRKNFDISSPEQQTEALRFLWHNTPEKVPINVACFITQRWTTMSQDQTALNSLARFNEFFTSHSFGIANTPQLTTLGILR